MKSFVPMKVVPEVNVAEKVPELVGRVTALNPQLDGVAQEDEPRKIEVVNVSLLSVMTADKIVGVVEFTRLREDGDSELICGF